MSTEPVLYSVHTGSLRRNADRVVGREALSRPHRFEVELTVGPDDDFDPDEAVGQDAELCLVRAGDRRRISLVVTEVSRVATRARPHGAAVVKLVLESKIALLRHRVDIRAFRNKSSVDITVEVLSLLGIAVEQKLSQSYEKRPYCVEWRESDFDFASRLLEDDGITYYTRDDGTVVLSDYPQAFDEQLGPLTFRQGTGGDAFGDAVTSLGVGTRTTAGKVSLRDFNPDHPSLNMDVSSRGPWPAGPEYYDYPGEYLEPAEGARKATDRTDALAAAASWVLGRSFAAQMGVGKVFDLVGAPLGIVDGPYTLRSLDHDWSRASEGFSVAFQAHAFDRIFRPLGVTDVPRLPNPITGFVTGAPGEDIHCDEFGRVKVHFPWDRTQPKDNESSHWIPVLQDNTGQSVAHPRVHWEVLCHFLEGDPDRPVVLGRVYNAEDQFPNRLPELKTRTALRSIQSPRTTDGSPNGVNQIEFEDAIGEQRLFVEAQKDQNVVIANDRREQTDNQETRGIKGHETVSIGNEQNIHVGDRHQIKIGIDQSWTVGANREVTVAAAQGDHVHGNETLTIGGSHLRTIGNTDGVSVTGNLSEKIGALVLETSVRTNMTAAERLAGVLVGGAIIEIAKAGKNEVASKGRVETVGGIVFTKAGKFIATRTEKMRKTLVGALYKVDAMKEILFAGGESFQMRSQTALFDATKKLTLKVGSTTLVIEKDKLTLDAPDTIILTTHAKNKQDSGKSEQNP